MRFQDKDYDAQLADAAWWLRLADYWNDRDAQFAELLRMRAREIQKTEDRNSKTQRQSLPS